MKTTRRDRTPLIIAAVLALLTLAAFARVTGNGWIQFFDDGSYVLRNTHIHDGLTWQSVVWAFKSTYNANWHPLTWISHMLDYQFYGDDPKGHHTTNLLFHTANVVLLFFVLNRLTKSRWPSAFVAALFAVHPLHVESVAWVAERKDVLSTFFWMLTMGAYALYAERPDRRRYALVVFAFALGLMSKPMLVSLPIVLLLLDYWPLRRSGQSSVISHQWGGAKRLVLEKLPLFAMSVASCVMTYIAQQSGGAMDASRTYTFGVRAVNALVGYVAYIVKMVWPAKLALLYPHPGDSLPTWMVIGSAVLLAGITYAVIRAAKRHPYLAVGWLWYVVTLVPVIGLVQVGTQAVADRYTYVPLIGLFVAVAFGVESRKSKVERPKSKRPTSNAQRSTSDTALSVIAGIAVVALAAGTFVQTGYWKDDITLFERSVRVTRDNYTMHGNLGAIYFGTGDLDKAVHHLGKAVRIRPDMADLHGSYGTMLFAAGKVSEAAEQFEKAMKLDPKLPLRDDLEMARQKLREAQGQDPVAYGKAVALFNEAVTLDGQGQTDQAVGKYREAIRLAPKYADPYVNLARAMYNEGKADEAVELCRKAIELKPDFGFAHSSLAIYLFIKNDYAGAWKEVYLCRKYGADVNPEFVQLLASKMPDPGE